jgi:prepilin-type N-terminal cleavage/methylation domain-containing protein
MVNGKNPLFQGIRSGFTMIELLVTMAISSTLIVTLGVLITQTTDGYALSQGSVNHLSQARAFFQLFESELSVRLPDTPLIHVSSLPDGSQISDQIAFVRTRSNDEQSSDIHGDLATSCYYVAFVEEPKQRVIPKLFRKTLNPTETQNLMDAGDDAEFPEIDLKLDEPVIDSVLSFYASPIYLNPDTGNDEPWDKTIELPPSHIKLTIRTVDESLSLRLTSQASWNRLAMTPKESELQMIRTVSYNISIGR